MTVKDRVVEYVVYKDGHGGRGEAPGYVFFKESDPSIHFFELVYRPGTYVGYHRHQGNEEIVYVVSGKMENFQDGNRCILEPGDAILVKSGQAHATRNVGDEDLKVLGCYAPRKGSSSETLPLPEEISDWAD